MTSIREIAQDPQEALSALEKQLGAEAGGLIRDMDRLGEPDEDWTRHLSYGIAVSYYEDAAGRAPYEEHVEGCTYCKELLQTLHPTALQIGDFTRGARHFSTTRRWNWPAQVAPFALAAGLAMVVVGGWMSLHSRPSLSAATAGGCVSKGGAATGCTLLAKAANFEASGEPQLARAFVVAGLAEAGVAEPHLKRVTAAIDPGVPAADDPAADSSSSESSRAPVASSAAILTAARSSFKSGKPVAGYEQILTYLKRSDSNPAPARAFEDAFVEPVRTAGIATSPPSDAAPPLLSAREWVGDVKLGREIDRQGAIAEDKIGTRFVAGEPVHLVTDLKDPPRNVPVRVVWFGPHGRKVREEINWTREGEKSVEFTAPNTRAWASGDYRAELWVADSKIRQEAFQITQTRQQK